MSAKAGTTLTEMLLALTIVAACELLTIPFVIQPDLSPGRFIVQVLPLQARAMGEGGNKPPKLTEAKLAASAYITTGKGGLTRPARYASDGAAWLWSWREGGSLKNKRGFLLSEHCSQSLLCTACILMAGGLLMSPPSPQ